MFSNVLLIEHYNEKELMQELDKYITICEINSNYPVGHLRLSN